MRGLNQWLEHDVRDRQNEMRSIAARVDALRAELARLGLLGGKLQLFRHYETGANGTKGQPGAPARPGAPAGEYLSMVTPVSRYLFSSKDKRSLFLLCRLLSQ